MTAPTAPQYGEEAIYEDYFGFGESFRFKMPDPKQFIEYQAMNEGQRARYQNATSTDLKINRRTEDATMRPDSARDRHALITSAVTGWNLYRRNEPVPFSSANLAEFLSKTNPKIVDDLEKAIRKVNPWLMSEVTAEDLREQIKDLQDQLDEKIKEEAKN